SAQGAQLSSVQKRVRINGVPRRATDLVGQIRAVTFSPQDIDLVTGPPQERRHYMDIALSQIDLVYARALQRYSRILLQRNHLLRRMQSGEASAGELDFWDDNLVETGSFITAKRLEAIFNLGLLCSAIHARLTGEGETLEVRYQGRALRGYEVHRDGEDTLATVKAIFHKALADARPRELGQGETVIGPHRDDLEILLEGTSVNAYGSRGQQRTAALAMKLAQAAFIEDRTGEQPVLLFDDVLSELDAARRGFLARQAADYHQVFITTTDLDRIEPHLLSQATIFRVEAGMVIADSTPF
ncbi:MAG: recF, partial [Dehalococcoidia bacterium]|nr:recF [Dehalococcoidia bacterium]